MSVTECHSIIPPTEHQTVKAAKGWDFFFIHSTVGKFRCYFWAQGSCSMDNYAILTRQQGQGASLDVGWRTLLGAPVRSLSAHCPLQVRWIKIVNIDYWTEFVPYPCDRRQSDMFLMLTASTLLISTRAQSGRPGLPHSQCIRSFVRNWAEVRSVKFLHTVCFHGHWHIEMGQSIAQSSDKAAVWGRIQGFSSDQKYIKEWSQQFFTCLLVLVVSK